MIGLTAKILSGLIFYGGSLSLTHLSIGRFPSRKFEYLTSYCRPTVLKLRWNLWWPLSYNFIAEFTGDKILQLVNIVETKKASQFLTGGVLVDFDYDVRLPVTNNVGFCITLRATHSIVIVIIIIISSISSSNSSSCSTMRYDTI